MRLQSPLRFVAAGRRRLHSFAPPPLLPIETVDALLAKYGVAGASVAVIGEGGVRTQVGGLADKARGVPMYDGTHLEIASLSKPLAAAFAVDYFDALGLTMDAPVNPLLAECGSPFRLRSAAGQPASWAEEVTLTHLLNHTGVGMHYVNGVPLDEPFPPVLELISGSEARPAPYGYASLELLKRPGTAFGYSGGGFLVLQHLLETREAAPVSHILAPWLEGAGAAVSLGLSFDADLPFKHYANGYHDDGSPVRTGRLSFPPLAAGALGTAAALADWLRQLALAYATPEGCGSLSHLAARTVLTAGPELGSEAFMRAGMGVGMFVFDVASAGGAPPSRWMLHQAANDGFRGLLLVCFDGPDAAAGPRGLVVLSNGDNQAMLLNAALTRALLAAPAAFSPPLGGLDWSRVPSMDGGFSTEGMKQEEIVNLGLKDLVLQAFVKP